MRSNRHIPVKSHISLRNYLRREMIFSHEHFFLLNSRYYQLILNKSACQGKLVKKRLFVCTLLKLVYLPVYHQFLLKTLWRPPCHLSAAIFQDLSFQNALFGWLCYQTKETLALLARKIKDSKFITL